MSAPDISTPDRSGIEAAAREIWDGAWPTLQPHTAAIIAKHCISNSDHSKVVQELEATIQRQQEELKEARRQIVRLKTTLQAPLPQ